MNDAHLTNLLERAGTDPDLDVAALVARGAAHGRRARARRRARLIGASAAVVAIGVGGVALGISGGDGTDRVHDLGNGSVATSPPSVAPASTAAPSAGPRTLGPDPARTAEVLASLLPGRTTEHQVWHDKDFRAGGLVWHSGRVEILVDTLAAPGLDRGQRARAWCEEGGALGECVRAEGGAGWVRLWSYDETSGNTPTGVVSNHADLYTEDGFMIAATAYNAVSEKDAEPIGPDPVLSPEELAKLVLAPVWLEDPQ